MSNAQDFIALEEQYGAHNYHPLDVVITRADGAWVWDVDGKKYMDFLAAYSAVNQGHCHPRLVKVMAEQMCRVALTSRAFRNDQLGPFCKEICELTGFDRVLPMNTGAEAVETAIKAARKWGYTVKGIAEDQAEILVFHGNFHGRTTTIVSFSLRAGIPIWFRTFHTRLQDSALRRHRSGQGRDEPQCLRGDGRGRSRARPASSPPPEGFLKQLRELTNENNCLLAVDEIPKRSRTHRQAFRLRARRHSPGHRHHRQGSVGRHVPGLCDLGRQRGDGRLQARRTRINLWRQSAGRRSRSRGTEDPGRGEHGAAISRIGAAISWRRFERSNLTMSNWSAARGLWIGIVLKDSAGGARRFCEALQQDGMLCKGDPRERHPRCPSLVRHTRGCRLGRRTARQGF